MAISKKPADSQTAENIAQDAKAATDAGALSVCTRSWDYAHEGGKALQRRRRLPMLEKLLLHFIFEFFACFTSMAQVAPLQAGSASCQFAVDARPPVTLKGA
jgi:hypothetical protein